MTPAPTTYQIREVLESYPYPEGIKLFRDPIEHNELFPVLSASGALTATVVAYIFKGSHPFFTPGDLVHSIEFFPMLDSREQIEAKIQHAVTIIQEHS